jgi:hypothetical protein
LHRSYDQALISISVQSGYLTRFRGISDDEFFTNLDGLLVANPKSDLVAVFDPKSFAPITLWTMTGPQDSRAFLLSCSVAKLSDNHAVAIVPYGGGFMAFEKRNKTEYLGPELFGSRVCTSESSPEWANEVRPAVCPSTIEGERVVTATLGSTQNEFVVVRETLDLDRMHFSFADCAWTARRLTSAAAFYYPWQAAKELNITPGKDVVESEHINIRFFPEKRRFVLNAAGGLALVPENGEAPRPQLLTPLRRCDSDLKC